MRKIKIGEKEYSVHYGQNAICAIENELDESINEFLERLRSNGIRLADIRTMVWAGLLKENRSITPEEVGELCDAAGVKLMDLLPECIKEFDASFARFIPEDKESEDTEKNE